MKSEPISLTSDQNLRYSTNSEPFGLIPEIVMTTRSYGRFSALLDSRYSPIEPWDDVLLETDDYIVAPTKGSIIPNWVLVIPRKPALSFAQLQSTSGEPTLSFVSKFAQQNSDANNWIWFEHGASKINSLTGCGIDHAHIHILLQPPFPMDDFASEVFKGSDHNWSAVATDVIYQNVDGVEDYHLFGNKYESFYRQGGGLGTQFFRKIVSRAVGQPQRWNYKVDEFRQNAETTVRSLRKVI